jgi:hypothetical protein
MTAVDCGIKGLLGCEVIDWLNRAKEQGESQPWHAWQRGPKPSPGCWRDAGWRAAVQIVCDEIAREPWVETPIPDILGCRAVAVDYRWRHDPDAFLCGIQSKLAAERARWAKRDGVNFYGAVGALDCAITAVRRIRREYTCAHEWGPVRSRPYSHDEPPEPDYRRCERCGEERDVEVP